MESNRRSIIKTLSYRIFGFFTTFSIAWVVTGEFRFGASIGIIDTLVKIGVYYSHERLWNRIDLGRKKPPDYNI